jgi:hypothetical protein
MRKNGIKLLCNQKFSNEEDSINKNFCFMEKILHYTYLIDIFFMIINIHDNWL